MANEEIKEIKEIRTCEEYVVNELFEAKESLKSWMKQFRELDKYSSELELRHQKLVALAKIIVENITIGEFGAKINGYYVRNEELAQALLDLYNMFADSVKREDK